MTRKNEAKTTADEEKKVYKFTRANLNETLDSVYDFVIEYIKANGYAPAVRDISTGLDIRSTSTVHAHLKRLVEAGRIVYTPGKRRAIALPAEALNGLQARQLSSKPHYNDMAEPGEGDEEYNDISRMKTRYIPLIGTVTAGVPILAAEQVEYMIPFPADYFNDNDELFFLHVRGDSMVDAAILDGDTVLVQKSSAANYGKIIVALIDDEATVKRLIKHEGKPYLKPENTAYDLIPFYGPGCSILGQVTHVLRSNVR